MDEILRVYLDPADIGLDGYPYAWHGQRRRYEANGPPPVWESTGPAIKDLVREQAGHRCERCCHPYPPGIATTCPRGEWTPCDEHCTHGGEIRYRDLALDTDWREINLHAPVGETLDDEYPEGPRRRWETQAQWRILTVHHLNGIKFDCRWWNLTALCQRCHLAIQGRVVMERVWPWEHSEWFKPHAAGWYATAYLGEDLSREETMARLDELLALERQDNAQQLGAWEVGPMYNEVDEAS